ncbi:hypothetical protein DGG96_02195 [Legionella qingyii]|uniref:Uncharacterized protein n=1 Tax=Legionella qingyii TaxID=2184757 RepID=A0A317U7I8_9GAMM|nr:hypothetical protein [Legionella qingyii]PWY56502.1 hypothetical protein DGG96_06995 [Legionella qingyii]PWY57141.1 hypothetical protein DGG96_02195 [Legionella qingyii]RUR25019.1 hypothetical protein ELY20_04480 [Legionella qingyii]RUR28709.1 hypothetical protein ELY16_01500 [Legionella qingyii]
MPHPLYEQLKSIILDDRLIYDEQYASEKLPCGLTNLQFAGLLLLVEYELPHKQKQDFKINPEVFHKPGIMNFVKLNAPIQFVSKCLS